ncbi:hypothetical protein J9A73_26460, partial [Klebsiella pneumoniae]
FIYFFFFFFYFLKKKKTVFKKKKKKYTEHHPLFRTQYFCHQTGQCLDLSKQQGTATEHCLKISFCKLLLGRRCTLNSQYEKP